MTAMSGSTGRWRSAEGPGLTTPGQGQCGQTGREVVRPTGLEPVRCYSLEPESSASANSATGAAGTLKRSGNRRATHVRQVPFWGVSWILATQTHAGCIACKAGRGPVAIVSDTPGPGDSGRMDLRSTAAFGIAGMRQGLNSGPADPVRRFAVLRVAACQGTQEPVCPSCEVTRR